MKALNTTDLRDKTVSELHTQLNELNEQLAKANLELYAGRLNDLRMPSKLKDNIARIKTVLTEKAVAAKKAAKAEKAAQKETKPTKTEDTETKE